MMNFYINRNLTEFENTKLYGKLATEAYAASVGGGLTTTGTKMCTSNRAIALGCTVSGSYSANQIIQEVDLSAKSNEIIHFEFQNMPSNALWVLNGNEPHTDIFYPKGIDAAKNWQALQSTIIDVYNYDCIFANNYWAGDMTYDEWETAGSGWNMTWFGSGDMFTCIQINQRWWFSFLFIVSGKMYSVSNYFMFTPGIKIINCTKWMYGTSSVGKDPATN